MIFWGHFLVLLYILYASIAKGLAMIQVWGGVITCIFNSYFHHNLLILMFNLSLYDACYHIKMEISTI